MGVRGRITSPGTVVGAAGPLNKAVAIGQVRREADAMTALATLRGASVYQMPWEHLESLLPAEENKGDQTKSAE